MFGDDLIGAALGRLLAWSRDAHAGWYGDGTAAAERRRTLGDAQSVYGSLLECRDEVARALAMLEKNYEFLAPE